jgi:hypothetical protein
MCLNNMNKHMTFVFKQCAQKCSLLPRWLFHILKRLTFFFKIFGRYPTCKKKMKHCLCFMWGNAFRVGCSQKKYPLGSQVVQAPRYILYIKHFKSFFFVFQKRLSSIKGDLQLFTCKPSLIQKSLLILPHGEG